MDPVARAALSSWSWRPEVIIPLVILGALFLNGWRRLRARSGRVSGARSLAAKWRPVTYIAGLLVIAIALLSPFDVLVQQLFFMHMIQHLLLIMIAPPLLLLPNPMPFLLWGLPGRVRLGVGGIVAFIVGGLFLMDTQAPGFGMPSALVIGLALASAAILLAIGNLAARSARRPVVSGREEMSGAAGTVIAPTADGDWWVMVHGERWRARSRVPLAPGDRVCVDRLDGLTLDVSPASESPTSRSASS